MSQDQPLPTDKPSIMPSITMSLTKVLDDKFQILKVMESDVDSYTLEATRTEDEQCSVIVRLLKPEAAAQAVIAERFNAEVMTLQSLVHHNVPRCLEASVTKSGQPYAVFAYFNGRSLRKILDDESCLRTERAINIIKQVCAALTAAHRLEIVEHNLSPRNVYLATVQNELDVVKMPGVGFVETIPAVGETFLHAPQNFSHNDSVVYKSPEGCLGKNLDERSTVYSIGCLLFELLTGTVPIMGRTALETGNRHLKQKPLLSEEARPDLRFPEELQNVVSKALEKESSARYSTILELQHALKRVHVNATPAAWVRPKVLSPGFGGIKTILPGEITSWNLVTSHRRTDDKIDGPGGLLGQIFSMCALGLFVSVLLIQPDTFVWIVPLIITNIGYLLWLARPRTKAAELPPPGYGKIATAPKD